MTKFKILREFVRGSVFNFNEFVFLFYFYKSKKSKTPYIFFLWINPTNTEIELQSNNPTLLYPTFKISMSDVCN